MHIVKLVETRNGCAMLEKEPRFDVLLNDVKVGQLYFNMRGYVGYLPLPGGSVMNIGERGITAFRREVSRINREAKHEVRRNEEPDSDRGTDLDAIGYLCPDTDRP